MWLTTAHHISFLFKKLSVIAPSKKKSLALLTEHKLLKYALKELRWRRYDLVATGS